MIAKRKIAMKILRLPKVSQGENIDQLEQVLELLEDFSSLANNEDNRSQISMD